MSWRTAMMITNWCYSLSALPRCLLLGGLAAARSLALSVPPARAQASTAQIAVLYDAFGKTSRVFCVMPGRMRFPMALGGCAGVFVMVVNVFFTIAQVFHRASTS
jgi:hypothetical protein